MTTFMTRKTFSGQGRGRPRKPDVARYPSGEPIHATRGERQVDIIRTATEARMRLLGVKKEDAVDPMLGCALGRLRFGGQISKAQLWAGQWFARTMSLQAVLDDVRPAYGMPILARLTASSGRDPYEAFDPEMAWDASDEANRLRIIGDIRTNACRATDALWNAEAYSPGAAYAVTRICLWDDVSAAGTEGKLGSLRVGLNALARLNEFDRAAASH